MAHSADRPPPTGFQVVAHAGYRGEQEPRALVIDGERWPVLDVIDRWVEPQGRFFKVRAADGCFYLLCCRAADGCWTCEQRWVLDA